MEEVRRQEISNDEIGYPVFDFAARYSRVVESAADQIVASNPDPQVRRNALLWKMNAVPAAFLALEHADPVAMVLDLWALCMQMTQYFESGAGRDLFADQQTAAIAAARGLQTEIRSLAGQVAKPEALPALERAIAQWAEEHPLDNIHFARASILTLHARLMVEQPAGLFRTVTTLTGQVADLRGRLALHADQLPRQARWQAELLTEEISERIVGAQITNAFALVRAERDAVLESIERQRLETIQLTLEAVRAERIALLEGVLREREIVLREVRALVAESLAELSRLADAQREEVLRAVDAQRRAAMEDLRAEPLTLKHDVEAEVRSATDLIFGRVLLLLGASYIVLLGTGLLGYFLLRKPRRTEVPLPEGKAM